MSYLSERVSYLKGLADGMDINSDKKEGKLLLQIIDVLDEMSFSIEELERDVEEIDEIVDAMDSDLQDLEEIAYGDDEAYDEFICPECGELIIVEESLFDEDCKVEVDCPGCGEKYIVCDDYCDHECVCDFSEEDEEEADEASESEEE